MRQPALGIQKMDYREARRHQIVGDQRAVAMRWEPFRTEDDRRRDPGTRQQLRNPLLKRGGTHMFGISTHGVLN